MFNKIINKLLENSSIAELFRTYLVGAFNLLFGLVLSYFFQFFLFVFISFPLRTYITNIFGFMIGIIVSYFLSRKVIFQLDYFDGDFQEFLKFLSINLLNLLVPLLVWYLINIWNPSYQKNELYFLIITIIIHGSILPIKYIIYKFFVFKDSL
jgi:putative flippase GtrA